MIVIQESLVRKEVYDFSWEEIEKLPTSDADNRGACDVDSSDPQKVESYYSPTKLLKLLFSTKSKDLNNPNELDSDCENTQKNTNENLQYNNMRNNRKKALYESIIKDVAKVVKGRLNENASELENFKDEMIKMLNKDVKWYDKGGPYKVRCFESHREGFNRNTWESYKILDRIDFDFVDKYDGEFEYIPTITVARLYCKENLLEYNEDVYGDSSGFKRIAKKYGYKLSSFYNKYN